MIIGSKELIRDINNHLVIETLIRKGPISRASLSNELGLTKATISNIVQDLIEQELAVEIGSDNTNFGRKPILLSFNKNAGFAICIDIQPNICQALLCNLLGDSIKQVNFQTPKDPNDLPSCILNYINYISPFIPKSKYHIVGITLSIHGVADGQDISFVPYYKLSGADLATTLKKELNIPIYIENEANLAAIGESTFVHTSDDLAFISIHTGVGIGLISRGRINTGFHGYCGEIGHTIVEYDGIPCPCGNKGCLEQYLSVQALLKEYIQLKHIDSISFEEYKAAYQSKDKDALLIACHFVKYLTICLNNVINAYNPEVVIVNSAFTSLDRNLLTQAISNLSCRMNSYRIIDTSTLGDTATLLGGICKAVKSFLKIKYLKIPISPL